MESAHKTSEHSDSLDLLSRRIVGSRAFSFVVRLCEDIVERKKKMSLAHPGSFDLLNRDSRSMRLDLAKVLSNQFQISHSFSLGPGNVPSGYHFGAVFSFLQGIVDDNGDLQGKAVLSPSEKIAFKSQWQLSSRPGYSMFQGETEYIGSDFTVNLKAINFHPSLMTGIFSVGFLQGITKRLSLGVEGVIQRPIPDLEEAGMNLIVKYVVPNGRQIPSAPNTPASVFTVNLQNLFGLQASYFHRVNESVELATELQSVLAGPQKESIASVSCKLEHRQASVRVQIDSQAKAALFLEERLFGRVALLLSGEIDHLKGRNRFGIGLTIES